MCGILAVLRFGCGDLPDDVVLRVERGLDSIRHRGPDARGSYVDSKRRFALGHVRLSVIDVSSDGTQPFWSACGRYAIVFNGEIYNYLELRNSLEQEGVAFRTATDTEVLLQALIHWGEPGISRLNGMWAFVFIDTQTGDCIVSRDRWGVKQLYWMQHGSAMVFCSEAKGLVAYLGSVPAPDCSAIGLYCKHGMSGQIEQSWFEGIRRFPTASVRRIRLGTGALPALPYRYWNYPESRFVGEREEANEAILDLLLDAIRIRLRSDVPLGLSLSGGLDSSCIAWLVRERLGVSLSAYTAWYAPEDKSELPQARRIASQFGHRMTPVSEPAAAQTLAVLGDAVFHLDGGHGSTIVPYLNLCRAAAEEITVIVEGQGADELLAGYVTFALYDTIDSVSKMQWRRAFQDAKMFAFARGWPTYFLELMRHSSHHAYSVHGRLAKGRGIFSNRVLAADPPQGCRLEASTENLANALRDSHSNNLSYLLQYSDALGMSVGLESRCPFLDFRLVELGFSIATHLLLDRGFGKLPLREIADGSIPEEVVWRRRKEGFTNRTEALVAQAVRESGFPQRGLRLAEEFSLVRPGALDSVGHSGISDTIAFRATSLALWLERFYG